MSILSGFLKTKKYRKKDDGNYQLQSEWTSSETVEMGDGNTLETNLGSIKGITSSLSSTDAGYALSASAGKSLQDNINTLNTNLNEKTTWKHLGYVTGTEEVTLPDEFEELYITVNTNRVKNDTVWADLFTCLIPNAILSDTSKQFVFSSSSGTGSTDFTVQARVNKNVAKLETCRTGTTNYSSTATFDICYR